mmetsp:Transcript_5790/g.11983  ORF Transcript_5790/g.11983 Transcript_5790/m.11983 type:complete len:184 (+) Transcript_5790:43-594(+)
MNPEAVALRDRLIEKVRAERGKFQVRSTPKVFNRAVAPGSLHSMEAAGLRPRVAETKAKAIIPAKVVHRVTKAPRNASEVEKELHKVRLEGSAAQLDYLEKWVVPQLFAKLFRNADVSPDFLGVLLGVLDFALKEGKTQLVQAYCSGLGSSRLATSLSMLDQQERTVLNTIGSKVQLPASLVA